MKSIKILLASLSVLAVIFVISCQQENIETQANNSKKVWADFAKKYGAKVEDFAIDATKGASVTTKAGTHFEIPTNAFIQQDGNSLSSSQVIFHVQEYNKISDMIINDKPTSTTDGVMLNSYGEFSIWAEADGKQLQLKDGKSIHAHKAFVPRGNTQKSDVLNWTAQVGTKEVTKFFDSQNNQWLPLSKPAIVNPGVEWSLMATQDFNHDADSRNDELNMFIAQIGPLAVDNWDVTMSIGNSTGVVFNNLDNAEAFAAYFIPAGSSNNTTLKFGEKSEENSVATRQNMIPVGTEGVIVSLAISEGKLYFDAHQVTSKDYNDAQVLKVLADLQPIEKDELNAQLEKLNK